MIAGQKRPARVSGASAAASPDVPVIQRSSTYDSSRSTTELDVASRAESAIAPTVFAGLRRWVARLLAQLRPRTTRWQRWRAGERAANRAAGRERTIALEPLRLADLRARRVRSGRAIGGTIFASFTCLARPLRPALALMRAVGGIARVCMSLSGPFDVFLAVVSASNNGAAQLMRNRTATASLVLFGTICGRFDFVSSTSSIPLARNPPAPLTSLAAMATSNRCVCAPPSWHRYTDTVVDQPPHRCAIAQDFDTHVMPAINHRNSLRSVQYTTHHAALAQGAVNAAQAAHEARMSQHRLTRPCTALSYGTKTFEDHSKFHYCTSNLGQMTPPHEQMGKIAGN